MSKFYEDLDTVRNDPYTLFSKVMDEVEAGFGYMPPNPTSPFVFALENNVIMFSDLSNFFETKTRRLYPRLAQTWDELFLHIAHRDWQGLFASPSFGNFNFLIGIEDVINRAVNVPGTNTRKLIIPKYTSFVVNETSYTLLYPVEIRVKSKQTIQVVYGTEEQHPLQKLTTNIIDWKSLSVGGLRCLSLPLEVMQLKRSITEVKTISGEALKHAVSFNDNFHYATVSHIDPVTNERKELITSLTHEVIDPELATAVLKVTGNVLEVSIPPIYVTKGLVGTEYKIEIFTTKGELRTNLGDIQPAAFAIEKPLDLIDPNGYSDILKLNYVGVVGEGSTYGGRAALTFEQARERILNNSLYIQEHPITDITLKDNISDRNYSLVKFEDSTSSRIYQASRALPQPETKNTTSGIGSRISKVYMRMEGLSDLQTVNDHGTRVTILPTTLYNEDNGITTPLSAVRTQAILNRSNDEIVSSVMANNFMYSPLHYVLDATNDAFNVRPYYLAKPAFVSKEFVKENETSGLSVTVGGVSVQSDKDGYDIYIQTTSGKTFRELDSDNVVVIMSFVPQGERELALLRGTLIGRNEAGELVYHFRIDTTFDIDDQHRILTRSFRMINWDNLLLTGMDLTTKFNIHFMVKNYITDGMEIDDVTHDIPTFMIQEFYERLVGVVHEEVTINFGTYLSGLWSKSRTIIQPEDYELHEEDVYDTYPITIYETEPNSTAVKLIEVNGRLTPIVKHQAGDPKLGSDGQPVIKHLKGTIKRDIFDRPILKNQRALLREVNLFLLDGAYYFATEAETVRYRESIGTVLVDWVNRDIESMKTKFHENTQLYFIPQSTIGRVQVSYDDNQVKYMESEQALRITLYVDRPTYSNIELRERIKVMVAEVIADVLKERSVSFDKLVSRIEEETRDSVVSFKLVGFGGVDSPTQITLSDDSQRLTIGKRLVNRTDGALAIEDDITFDFSIHSRFR